jgi:hypothetical protein
VFFGILYFSSTTQPIFMSHNFKTVPFLTVSLQKNKRLESEEFYKEEDRWLIRADQVHDSQTIIDYFNKRLNTNTKLVLPFSTILQRNLIFLVIVIILVSTLKYVRIVLLQPHVWFLIAMMVFVICTGGIVYTIIHGVPWFKFDRDQFGNVYVSEYFMKGQRGQWAGEGYIFSFLVTITGLVWLFVTKVDKLFERSFKRRVAIIVAVIVIFVCQ